jgi:hypothetical protein
VVKIISTGMAMTGGINESYRPAKERALLKLPRIMVRKYRGWPE